MLLCTIITDIKLLTSLARFLEKRKKNNVSECFGILDGKSYYNSLSPEISKTYLQPFGILFLLLQIFLSSALNL